MSWREHSRHPNSQQAREYRHKQLKQAASTFQVKSRIGAVRHYAKGKKVLDVGCVSHNFAIRSGAQGNWLHEHVRSVAAECLGVDYDAEGVAQMRAAGYDVVHADITADLTPILERGPFDVVVAGEVIEHLPAPQALLDMARQALRPGGRLIITTPNPYNPRRQRAGAMGITWENVDHVFYAFPSGIAEMADRAGLVLERFGTVGWPYDEPDLRQLWTSVRDFLAAVRARKAGEKNPVATGRWRLPLPPRWLSPLDLLTLRLRGKHGMMGENAIYVLKRPTSPA